MIRKLHPNVWPLWADNEAIAVHYLSAKPWDKGFGMNNFEEWSKDPAEATMEWWWDAFKEWEANSMEAGKEKLVSSVRDSMPALQQ